ncbi:expressed unknown protein [Seminavis robusta]|uniref:Uncharacterized protein n=1 Tax=Seminavis robusta TaxID=568900 RepID=A0A9N8DSW8_9STRA|nr:expressed unknown protein [Seminavis robusta]|eukprot:Sro319_g116200.1 n/a (353) ;mRNA; f:22694-23752
MATQNLKKRRQSSSDPSSIASQFQGVMGRAGPGQPPRERFGKTYNLPFSELNSTQRAAASEVLGIADEKAWELAMPRRVQGMCAVTVVSFQTKTWRQLSSEHQKLATEQLSLNESLWNGQLAPFHDDLWKIPGITLTPEEFVPVLKTIQRMGTNHVLTKKDVAQFLWSLQRVLLPSQGVLIAKTLKSSSSWESLLESTRISDRRYNTKFHIHLVVACFLTFPHRFVDMGHTRLNLFWDDDSCGCVWGNASEGQGDHHQHRKPYREVLHGPRVRRCVASILTGKLPERVTEKSQLPVLPKSIVKCILDDLLGVTGPKDPFQVSWLSGYDAELTMYFETKKKAPENQERVNEGK